MSTTRHLHRLLLWTVGTVICLPPPTHAGGETTEVPTRDQIADRYKWNLDKSCSLSKQVLNELGLQSLLQTQEKKQKK